MKRFISLTALASLVLLAGGMASAESITTGSIIHEMTDLRRLGEFPDPAFKTVQFSSYDRRSHRPGGPGWFANSDGFGGEPIPNFEKVLKEPGGDGVGEYLICDVQGPGAIVRTWTAASSGRLRVYLDGAEQPLFEGDAQAFLLEPYLSFLGSTGLTTESLEGTFTQRNAAYCPIPFAQQCKMVWIGKLKDIHFYQAQIRLYEPSAEVKTFTPADVPTYKDDILQAVRVLGDPNGRWDYASTRQPSPIAVTLAPDEKKDALVIGGPAAIERLTLKVSAADLDQALKQTILHIHFDDHSVAQVQSPLGDFFGAAPGVNPQNTVPFTVEPDGIMTCRFVMPFTKSCRIVLENLGGQSVTVTGAVLPMDYAWNEKSSMHFHARWRADHDLVASNVDVRDLPFILANGQGVYVGTASLLLNPNPIPTSYGNWWGEGDEKIFVDDDAVPSTFGTGSEDYYNYAWSSGDIFVFPYFGQPRNDGPANRGFVTNNRFHILDPLPFRSRIAFYMELYSHERTPGVSYARLAYFYARPGVVDDHPPITREDVRHLELPPDWQPAARMGAANSVFHQAEAIVKDKPPVTLRKHALWSGGQVMVWNPEKVGDELRFEVPISESGKYSIRLMTALTPASGRFTVRLNDRKLECGQENGVIDLYVPHRTLLRDFASEPAALDRGKHTLTLRYEGKAEGSPGNDIGVDVVWIQKQ
ncbi:MAG: DUF2961 domain-containing protein [bacterium]